MTMRSTSSLKRLLLLAVLPCAALAAGCDDSAIGTGKAVSADAGTAAGLSADQAQRVVAKIGERAITLGDFAKALERMDQFDRLRYQTKERRRELLQDMIDVELLAIEAKRRGLDKDPETEDAVRQILRDAVLAKAREGIPAPAELTNEEVRAYYDANPDKFTEPERRRVAAILVADKKDAEKVLKDAKKVKTAQEWGELWAKSSMNAPKQPPKNQGSPVDLAGDLGIVGPLDDARGANPKVPESVRQLVFKLSGVGAVADEIPEIDGKFFIVRMNGQTPPHKRTLAEAERSIRVLLVQQKMADREAELEKSLRARFHVEVDDKALADIKLPPVLETGASPWAKKAEAQDAGAPPPDAGK